MHLEVERISEDSGELLAVVGSGAPDGRFVLLRFEFEAGVLEFTCDDDTDEIVVAVVDRGHAHREGMSEALPELVGLAIEYTWELRNHRGYVDGFQLRLRKGSGRGRGRDETVQLEVAASAIDVHRVT